MTQPHATEANFDEILQYLCEPDGQEQAALESVRVGDEQTVRQTSLGLKEGASLRNKLEAVTLRKPDILQILLEENRVLSEDVVAEAFQRKDRMCIRILLDFGWDINNTLWAASPLCFAIHDKDFMNWLIDHGADINARYELDLPVLASAIALGDIQVVHLLLEKGADVMHGNLLHSAVERKNQREGAELVDFLARKGVDVNAHRHTNSVAWKQKAMSFLPTPLYLACDKENIPVVQALLQHGADPARKVFVWGRNGPSALERTRSINNPKLSALLFGAPSKF
ncbi:hypothetical protein M409DRAFT_71470 [Zasmidium cellare ATCC 36951]|uniref:Uncharacterized protein n=1 Tax=Zasmidium cellare ATCC 36951 TaxID=1080233 RepID=A0A6A6BW29_ZASCE|nr:uncharacterized protein M409DRAFT_71470 [Zasmidium cellare ATCC 36951]KAF2158773.1 hypothetical protein M409DRAFT_71470 [Zasmidium cellare ATCC 36951]